MMGRPRFDPGVMQHILEGETPAAAVERWGIDAVLSLKDAKDEGDREAKVDMIAMAQADLEHALLIVGGLFREALAAEEGGEG